MKESPGRTTIVERQDVWQRQGYSIDRFVGLVAFSAQR